MEGAVLREKRAHEARIWLAWHVAALGRAKRLPRLNTLIGSRPEPREDDWKADLAGWEAYAASYKH
jgi:hypothetical protein